MPKTKLQHVIFNLMMVLVMVYALVCYNIAFDMGGMSNRIFLIAFAELPIMGAIGFVLETFIVGKLAQKLAFRLVNPQQDKLIFVILAISALTVCLMCPLMSLFATVLFQNPGSQVIAVWLQTTVRNFPMALCFQIFYAGPFVRFLFKKIFREKKTETMSIKTENAVADAS